MTPLLNPPQRRFLRSLFLFLFIVLNIPLHAAVRETWVQHFDGGFPNKASQPVAMQLDSQGNIYIVGSTANASNLTDYVTLKYAPNGTLLWSKRYGTTNSLNNTPRAMAVDTNKNVYITGTSVTVKYSEAGEELWTALYSGRGMAIQGTNIYVTGFSDSEFITAKLSTNGGTLWTRSHHLLDGPDVARAVVTGADGGVYVAGEMAQIYYRNAAPDKALLLVKYSPEGEELLATLTGIPFPKAMNPLLLQISSSGRAYVSYNPSNRGLSFYTLVFDSFGVLQWQYANVLAEEVAMTLIGDTTFETGSIGQVGLVVLNPDGTLEKTTQYPSDPNTRGKGQAIVADGKGGVFATGYVQTNAEPSDLAIVRFDGHGNVVWAHQYNGTANGHDEGKAIARDTYGNVYVAAVSDTTAGGREIVLIKYSESATIEQSPTGTILLQFPGTPGQPYKIQASTNLPNWLDIGLGTTTTNGLLQFEDTNATKYPFLFYQTVTP